MKYKAIIFDMDGTIIDTEHIWHQATHDLITSRNIPISEKLASELSLRLSGSAMRQSCQIIKDLVNLPDDIEDLIKEKTVNANQLYANGVRFIEGFKEFHKKTLEHNLKTGLATNAGDHTLAITNKALNLEQFFGIHIYNISHVNQLAKPHPALYLHAAAQLGIDPSECIAIEDSKSGVQAAVAAGMFCIGINTAKKPELLAECHLLIQSYDEIELIKLLELEPKKK